MSLHGRITECKMVTGKTCSVGEGNVKGNAWTRAMRDIQLGVEWDVTGVDIGDDGVVVVVVELPRTPEDDPRSV